MRLDLPVVPVVAVIRVNRGGQRGYRLTQARRDGVSVAPVGPAFVVGRRRRHDVDHLVRRSEEHTSELQSLMRISYAVFCLKKKTKTYTRLQKHYQERERHQHTRDT